MPGHRERRGEERKGEEKKGDERRGQGRNGLKTKKKAKNKNNNKKQNKTKKQGRSVDLGPCLAPPEGWMDGSHGGWSWWGSRCLSGR